MSRTFDVVVVGGGIMGCSTAFHLSQRGLKVALVERANIGSGGTGRSSAIIRQHYSNEITARMALHSLHVFQNFQELLGDECGFTCTGFVAVVEAKDRAGLEENVALQRGVGIRTQILGADDLREIMPGVDAGDVVAAAYEPESGYADPYLTVNAYANAARRLGTTVLLNSEVTAVHLDAGRVTGVQTPTDNLEAPVVVNCAGPWGARVAAMAGADLPVNPCRVQVALFRRPPGHEAAHPVVADFIHATYFRSETGNLTLTGLVDPAEADAVVDPDRYNENVDFDFVHHVGERLVCRYPAMEHSHSAGGFASLYGITPDWHPVLDEVPAGSGFFVCAGFSGHGFKLGPAVGVAMADLITGATEPRFDPRMFRLARFAEDDPVRGRYEYSIAG